MLLVNNCYTVFFVLRVTHHLTWLCDIDTTFKTTTGLCVFACVFACVCCVYVVHIVVDETTQSRNITAHTRKAYTHTQKRQQEKARVRNGWNERQCERGGEILRIERARAKE